MDKNAGGSDTGPGTSGKADATKDSKEPTPSVHDQILKDKKAFAASKLGTVETTDTSRYVQCPHCGRKFEEKVAEKHIPRCEQCDHNKGDKDKFKGGKPAK